MDACMDGWNIQIHSALIHILPRMHCTELCISTVSMWRVWDKWRFLHSFINSFMQVKICESAMTTRTRTTTGGAFYFQLATISKFMLFPCLYFNWMKTFCLLVFLSSFAYFRNLIYKCNNNNNNDAFVAIFHGVTTWKMLLLSLLYVWIARKKRNLCYKMYTIEMIVC